MPPSFLLVVTPQQNELEALLSGVRVEGYEADPLSVGRLDAIAVPSLRMLFAVGGNGKVQLALQTQHIVDRFKGIEMILCAGGAGSLVPDLQLGDVVVGTSTVEHDYKERFVAEALPSWQTDSAALDAIRRVTERERFGVRVHYGPIASGDEDIVDRARSREIARITGALCVAWEGAGGARTAAFNGLRFLEIRAITDGADADAAASFHENVDRVMPPIGSLLVRWRR